MKTFYYAIVIISYLLFASLSIWLLGRRSQKPIKDIIEGLLELIAVYSFIMGLCVNIGLFDTFKSLASDLTSSDPLLFLAGNFYLLAIFFSTMTAALGPGGGIAYIIKIPFLLVLSIILIGYSFLHLLLVVPVTYFGYLITSIPIDAVLNSATDVVINMNGEEISIKAMFQNNELVIRNFALGLPAFAMSVLMKLVKLLRKKSSMK